MQLLPYDVFWAAFWAALFLILQIISKNNILVLGILDPLCNSKLICGFATKLYLLRFVEILSFSLAVPELCLLVFI